MTKPILSTAVLAVTLFFGFSSTSQAEITSTIGLFDEAPNFSGNYPTALTNLGNFSFTIPTGFAIGKVTISGTFGNNDVPGTTNVTADSDYYIDGTAIQVAACDTPNIASTGTPTLACDAGSQSGNPTAWSYTLTSGQVATINSLLASGSLDFNVIQNYYGSVETGPITLDISPVATPEPATISIMALGLAGLSLLRRRKI
jgi:hypothetical protein